MWEFLEAELNKDQVLKLGERAMDELREWEQKLLPLGVTPQNRLKRSLFELFRK